MDTVATDNAAPAPGQVLYYLVRVENACGANLGDGDAGSRAAVDCP